MGPVRMVQALQGTLEALHEQAARIAKNETTPTVPDSHGALQTVADEGGRHTMRSMVLDVQSAARSFDERAQVVLEKAQAGADTCRAVGPHSLSVQFFRQQVLAGVLHRVLVRGRRAEPRAGAAHVVRTGLPQ